MKCAVISVVFCTSLLWSSSIFSQSVSNEGTDFFAVFPIHVPSRAFQVERLAEYYIFITAKQNTQVVVSAGFYNSGVLDILANQVRAVPIPRNAAYLSAPGMNSGKAIRVQVEEGKPKVVVWGHIFAGARSAASLILPTDAMGQQYFSMNYDNSFNLDGGQNYITVVATEPGTTVLFKTNGNTFLTVTLPNTGDVYQYITGDDPTGTEIVADPVTSPCKRFAVFSGSSNTIIGSANCSADSSDPLYQQNYPVESWGQTYGFIPFSSQSASGSSVRTAGNIYRILAKEDGTEVSINGTRVATLNSGEYYPRSYSAPVTNTPSIISATKPVAVAQYALSQSCAGGNAGVSDPDMVILNPIEYSIKNITVYSSNKESIEEQYLNVIIPTTGAASFRINGQPSPVPFTRIPSSPGYSYIKLNLNRYGTGDFTLSAMEGFNAIAYGFGDHESYAYSAGTSLASSQTLNAIRIDTKEELANACTKENFNFKLTLPAKASKLTWLFDPSEAALEDTLPTEEVVVMNGKTYYEYLYPRTRIFDIAGTRTIKVLAEYAASNSCFQQSQEIEFVFEVYDPAVPDFNFSGTCALDSIQFVDASAPSSPDKPISGWIWDFGDGSVISTLQNPKHKYETSGQFAVNLIVDNGTGCLSDPLPKTVLVRQLPLANYTTSDATCENNTLEFIDESNTTDGQLYEWLWDFGDGTTSTEQNPVHTFPTIGNYTVSLQVVNDYGCRSLSFSRTVTVFAPSLEAGEDRTIVRGGQILLDILAEGTNLKYKWSPSTGLNRDDVKTPVASPDVETEYTVTITSDEGCVLNDRLTVKLVEDITIPNTFTPNGDGINDDWVIKYLNSFSNASVKVFTRYGVQVFNSMGYFSPWNGSWRGEFLSPGTYYYIITIPIRTKPYSGFVTIIR